MKPFSDAYLHELEQLDEKIRAQGITLTTGVEDGLVVFARRQDGKGIEVVTAQQVYDIPTNTAAVEHMAGVLHDALEEAGRSLAGRIAQGEPYVQLLGYPKSPDFPRMIEEFGIQAAYYHTDHRSGVQEYATAPGTPAQVANTVNLLREQVRAGLEKHGYMCVFQAENLPDVYRHYRLDQAVPFRDVRDVLAFPMQFSHAHVSMSLHKGGRKLFNETPDGHFHTIYHAFTDRLKDHPDFGDGEGIYTTIIPPDSPRFKYPRDGRRSAPLREVVKGSDRVIQCTNFELAEDSPLGLREFVQAVDGILPSMRRLIDRPGRSIGPG